MAGKPPAQLRFGHAVADFGGKIVAEARSGLANPTLSPAESVHEVRKALKRWRALMKLLSSAVGGEADGLRIAARDLMRSLATARDAQSALDAIADVSKGECALTATSARTVAARLTAIRDAAEGAAMTAATRRRLTTFVDEMQLALDRWPLQAITFDIIADGLTETYRRARQLIPDKWYDTDPEHLHELRKRVVEHRHQMELIEHLWPRLGRLWGEEAQRLRTRLGTCQDLAVLERYASPHQPLAHWRSKLTPAIAERQGVHLKAAARLAGRLFAEKPKAFRRRIAALWGHRMSEGDDDLTG